MLNDLVLLKDLIEDLKWTSPVDHVVLRDDLEPIHPGLRRENVVVMGYSQSNSDPIVSKSVEAIGWHCELLFRAKDTRVEACPVASLQHGTLLSEVRLGTIGSAITLALAAIFPGVLAAALALAVVLALTGVFRGVGFGFVLGTEEHTGVGRGACGGRSALWDGLCIKAGGRPAKQTCEGGGEREIVCCAVFH
jgi:hypothetical protein